MIKKPIVKKSKKLYMFLVCFGMLLIAAVTLIGFVTEYNAEQNTLSSRLIGFGSGFGSAFVAAGSIGLILMRKKPEDVRQQKIDENDERNIRIREKSAYGTYFITIFSLMAVGMVFVLLDYIIPAYIIIGVMAINVFSYFVFIYHNNKKL